jgi:hypothetical protein
LAARRERSDKVIFENVERSIPLIMLPLKPWATYENNMRPIK